MAHAPNCATRVYVCTVFQGAKEAAKEKMKREQKRGQKKINN